MRQFSETLEHDKCCGGNRHVLPLRYGWNYLLSVRDGRSSDVLLPRLWALTCWTEVEGLWRAVDVGYLSLVGFMDIRPIFQCIDRKHSTPLISSQQAKKKCVCVLGKGSLHASCKWLVRHHILSVLCFFFICICAPSVLLVTIFYLMKKSKQLLVTEPAFCQAECYISREVKCDFLSVDNKLA